MKEKYRKILKGKKFKISGDNITYQFGDIYDNGDVSIFWDNESSTYPIEAVLSFVERKIWQIK